MLGTNDAVCPPNASPGCDTPTPEQSAANILRMAESAQSAGAKVLVLTPPPAVCKADCDTRNEVAYGMWTRDAFTGSLADVLRKSQPVRGVKVADLRRKLPDPVWERFSSDGLHPSDEGNRMIARFVSAYLSRGGTRQARTERGRPATREAKRAPDDEQNPFARKPQDHRYKR